MTLLVQITDTHIVERGSLLYGKADTARHLRETVAEVNNMEPRPDLVLFTGDLVEHPGEETYSHFAELIEPLKMPVHLMPGNHDNPAIMAEFFSEGHLFPAEAPHYQYAIEAYPLRILCLNSHFDNSELPHLGPRRLAWLEEMLNISQKPTLIAIHHPPMKTGIGFIDMVGSHWYQGLNEVIERNPQVLRVICGHGHIDLNGRIGNVPVSMMGSCAHQLIAGRVVDIAPAFIDQRVPAMLHHYMEGEVVSGYYPWPFDADELRIDKTSGMGWEDLKDHMRGELK